jgi:transcriptional regulator with XRE-family HTH domain
MNSSRKPELEDFDLVQAGSLGMSFAEVVQRYGTAGPGEVLTLARTELGQSLEAVADGTRIPVMALAAIEANRKRPTPQQVVALAKHLNANLRLLMEAFELVKSDAPVEAESMGIAAKFDGDLDQDEKEELRALFASVKAKTTTRRR